jgi:hypothetical protein
MRYGSILILNLLFTCFLAASISTAGPLEGAEDPRQTSVQAVHEAAHEVDHAWEAYHRAALGGTVASPALQADIEEHLHQARTLITQALEAAQQGDERQVERLVQQVHVHTTHAIEGSKEQKK